MASRILKGASSIRSLKSAVKLKTASSPPCPVSRFTLSRVPSELGGVASLLPLHSAVAAARMTSCLSITSRRSASLLQDEIDGT